MKLKKGFFKIIHAIPYSSDASFETKSAVMEQVFSDAKKNGYDGIVTNVDFSEGYLDNEKNWELMVEKARLCHKLGLRLWLYDENYYPSGAAGIKTLAQAPETEAVALAAVYHVLNPGEEHTIALPYGHLEAISSCYFLFEGEQVTEQDFLQAPTPIPYSENGYHFTNQSDKKMLCLAFFTKPAFEGTHCQHNAASERRYIDIGNPVATKTFIENTYQPYCNYLKDYIQNGTIESFFTDETSYMAVYFNLKKKAPTTTHLIDEKVPLWAMVNWSHNLQSAFSQKYGYDITDHLPWLFMGNSDAHKQVRSDFYSLLTELAQKSFFIPLSEYCEKQNIYFSGHILLEEKITDHPRFQGNFFSLLKQMQIPGMDMLDSLPERVWNKSFTAKLVSSISQIHRDGDVMDEVSCHFQNKFKVPVEPIHLFNSILQQYSMGANIFTSYYDDTNDTILRETPTGETVLKAIKRVMNSMENMQIPSIMVHYPIENIMENTTSPVDIAKVYDSTLNEYNIPYPIHREDLDSTEEFVPFIENNSWKQSKEIEKNMEDCMYFFLNRQIPFLFCDTQSIEQAILKQPKIFIIPPQRPTKELLSKIGLLSEKGCKVIALTDNGRYKDAYVSVAKDIILADKIENISDLFNHYIKTSGDTFGISAMWNEDKLLLVNSCNTKKKIELSLTAATVTDCYLDNPAPFTVKKGNTKLSLPPYGVMLVTFS